MPERSGQLLRPLRADADAGLTPLRRHAATSFLSLPAGLPPVISAAAC